MDTKTQIAALEERLIAAMKTSNVAELDILLANHLVFTNHLGHLITKEDDLNTHRGGELEIYSLEVSAQLINVFEDTAVVSVVQDISGSASGHTFAGQHRYTRVWKQIDGNWQVIAGHESQIIS